MKKLAYLLAAVLIAGMLAGCDAATEQDSSSLATGSSSSVGDDSSGPASSSGAYSRPASGSRSTSSSSSASSNSGTASGSSSQAQNGGQSSTGASPATTPSSQQPATTPQPETPAPTPAPAPSPVPEAPAPQPEQPKGAYDYPFDVGQIQNDMIAWGQAAGMTHEPGARGPDNSSWDNPITASESFQGEILKTKLREYVQFYTSASWQGYGNEPVAYFTVYVSGTTFYVLH